MSAAPDTPAWTLVYVTKTSSRWQGQAWEFYDASEEKLAQARHAKLTSRGTVTMLRPFYAPTDFRHLGWSDPWNGGRPTGHGLALHPVAPEGPGNPWTYEPASLTDIADLADMSPAAIDRVLKDTEESMIDEFDSVLEQARKRGF